MDLDEPIEDLSSEFLEQASIRLKKHLDDLSQFSDCQVNVSLSCRVVMGISFTDYFLLRICWNLSIKEAAVF